MTEKRVSINEIIESQIPDFLLQDSPTFTSFLKQYYKSLDYRGGAADLAVNLKGYKNIEEFTAQNLIPYTVLQNDLTIFTGTISVVSTEGWPDKNGLLKIDDEIIHYKTKTSTTFEGCSRGFSGIDSIKSTDNSEFLSFSSSTTDSHSAGVLVYNLSNLFLREFFIKFKSEFLPGFENRNFFEGIDIQNILTRAKDFYKSKGTDTSYKILFKLLFGEDIEIIKPQDFTLIPSDNNYFITKNVLLEKVSGGDPLLIKGSPLFQDISGIGTVSSSIYNIEYRPIDGKDFYEVSLDSADFNNLFEASGKTKLLEDVPAGSDTILVDSTVGFSKAGNVHIKPKDSEFYINVSYTDKTVNQFLGCQGISAELEVNSSIVEDKFAYSYIGFGQTSRVDFLLTNVVDSVDFSNTSNLKVDDLVTLSGFGKDLRDFREFNSWFYNIPTDHSINTVNQVSSNSYRVTLFDTIIFYIGENVSLSDKFGKTSNGTIVDIVYPSSSETKKYVQEVVVQITTPNHTITDSIILSKRVTKGSHYTNQYDYISKIPTGVQNTYITPDEKNFYVASTGMPNYEIFATDTRKDLTVVGVNTTEIIDSVDHGFYDGENVYFIPTDSSVIGVDTGFYFVSYISDDKLSLSFSKADSFGNKHVSFTPNGGSVGQLFRASYENKEIKNQKLFKKFSLKEEKTFFDDKNRRSTDNKYIGMLGNGVEILSPTLFDENVYYGRLTDIEVTNSGEDYDVINPPELEVVDSQGSGCKAHVNVSGSVQEIKVLKAGVGYATKPEISIKGGNGTGCVLESNLVKTRTVLQFKPTQPGIDIAANTINFGENHNLQIGEEVIYNSNKNSNIGGLVGDAHYYVSTPTSQIIKLHSTPQDATSGINTISITGISSGFHAIESLTVKNTISTVYVKEKGEGYSNRAVKIPSENTFGNTAGINTYDSYIYARKHGFNNGDIVHYSSSGTPLSGMNTTSDYYISVVNANQFRVSAAGTIEPTSNYTEGNYVNFTDIGVGTHTFAYPKITITINATSEQGDIDIVVPELEAKILGSIDDVFVEDGGVSYGCTSQFNYHRRPDVRTKQISSKALIAPIIVDGTIVDVKIINRGHGYRLDSDIIVTGDGNFADLVPTVEDGKITSVRVLNGGVGYNNANTVLTVEARGRDAKFLGNVTNWKVNQVEKLKDQFSDEDDGFLLPSRNESLGLQFVNFFVPKKLRVQLSDNFTQNNVETPNDKVHSPIIGFAYDGNPIYGPYGYQNPLGGGIKQLQAGYEVSVDNTPGIRPTSPKFIAGFFVNDYVYTGTGDLDESNGRYCKTPEYPDGVYAYFVSQTTDQSGKSEPTFPYLIGPYFHSQPIEENFLPSINQDVDFTDHGLTRNVSQYYITSNNSKYRPIDKVDEKFKQEFRVSEIRTSGIKDTAVFSPGDNYKTGDTLVIKNRGESGSGANIAVSKIKGKTVNTFSVNETVTSGVVFDLKKSDTIECKLTDPHEILNNEIINISGISTTSSKSIEGNRSVSIRNKTTKLTADMISATGVTTTIYVNDISGFRVEDMIGIGTEICRIIRIDSKNNSFDINRLQYPGIHTAFNDNHLITLKPTVFEIKISPDEIPDDYVYTNEVTYFDPKVTVGSGTTGSVRSVLGVGGTIVEYRTVPSSSIYIPEHKFFTGQELKYHVGLAGTSLYINNVGSGVSIPLTDGQTVYAVNLGKDHVGISTIGFTSTTGIGTQLNAAEFVNFDSSFPLVGAAHSLSTTNPEITGTIERYSASVGTAVSHGLTSSDRITFSINNREIDSISVFYNPVIRKMITGPISFGSSAISISDNTIDLSGEQIEQGEKVVYKATTPATGLSNNKIYYVLKTDKDKIKLTERFSDIDKNIVIDIDSVGGTDHELYKINPPLRFIKNDTISFDISDTSLSEMDLEFYEDPDFTRRLELIGNAEDGFAIERTNTPGQADAKVEIKTTNSLIPSALYYTLIPKGPTDVRKNQISRDLEVVGSNKIDIVPHSLNTDYIVTVSDNSTFLFNLLRKPSDSEKSSYNSSNTTVTYTTTSKTADGPIDKLRINFAGVGYDRLPIIESIKTVNGKNANIKLISDDIGKVEKYARVKDGFDYPTDPTLSPLLSTPSVVGIKDIRTIDYIGITTGGRGYNQTPTLIVPDNTSIKLIPTLEGGSITKVDVAQNAIDFSEPLDIVTIHHSQGYDIDFFTINGSLITAELSNTDILTSGVSTSFPFDVGDEVYVEGCRLTADSDHLANFNSDAYGYKFFKVTGISTTNNTVTYDMTGIATGTFGVYEDGITLGYLVNKKQVPQFEMVLKDDVKYLSKEKVTGPTFVGRVMEGGWDNDLNQLRVGNSFGQLRDGDKLTGESSKVIGTVEYFSIFNLRSTLGVSRDKVGELDRSVGILNDFQQRISDNFYYQKFSYSIKSQLSYDKWKEPVRSLIHPSGFKEFSDFEFITQPTPQEVSVGIAKSADLKPIVVDSTSSLLVNVDKEVSFNDRIGFNMVYEEDLLPDGSTQKIFMDGGIPIKSYILSKTNKVIKIDNIDDQFDGTSIQKLDGTYADASDLLDLNRQFLIDEVLAKVNYNYVAFSTSASYDEAGFKAKTGRLIDAVSSDLKYNANSHTVSVASSYWSGGNSIGINTTETIYGFNYLRFLGQYIVNNQTPPTYYQTGTPQLFNLSVLQDPANDYFVLNHDARDLIVENKREILDKALASVAVPYPTFIIPGSTANEEQNRYAIGYKLVKENTQQIINESYSASVAQYTGIATQETKARNVLARFVDAVATDLFTGGNRYARQEALYYFDGPMPDNDKLVIKAEETNYLFNQAKEKMRLAVRNGLGVTYAASEGPPIYGVGTTIGNNELNTCQDVQNTIITLSAVVTGPIGIATLTSLPVENVGTYSTGVAKCFRDLKYIVDGVAQDIAYDTNQHTVRNTKFYFDAQGNQKTDGLVYEEAESIYIFRTAMDYMKKAVRNELYYTDDTIVPLNLPGVGASAYTASIQTDIESLVGILTVAIGNSSLASIPTVGFGTGDCANVRQSLRTYVGIATNIIGIGTDQGPGIVTYPSLSKGGIIVGLSSFKLKSDGQPLFKKTFDSSDTSIVNTVDNILTFANHNFQSGQEMIYNPLGGTRIGIATTSYATGDKDIIMEVDNISGSGVKNNGIGQPVTVTGVATVLVPAGPNTQLFNDVVGTGATNGEGVVVDVIVTYDPSSGVAISTAGSLVKAGKNFGVGEVVTIGGTFFNGSSPANDYTFTVTAVGPSGIQTEANNTYTNVPGISVVGTGASFTITRNNTGQILDVTVSKGGSGYTNTGIVTISGTNLGGVAPGDNITFTPSILGRNTLPDSVFVFKQSDSEFKLSGLSTALPFDITSVGVGTATIQLKDPNPSTSIAIDGIVQNQLRRKNLEITLGSAVGLTTNFIQVAVGINSLVTDDIINIDNEYILIKSVGTAGTDILEVERNYLGTVGAAYTVGAASTIMSGDYNIVGDTIFFTTPPYGKIGPVGLETGSTFNGRAFSRRFDPDKTEDQNVVFDDISLAFTGIAATEFTLKVQGDTTTAVYNDVNKGTDINNNPFVFINNVFQRPRQDFTVDGSSANVLRFLTGTPSAGRISKVAITTGFGYQTPLAASGIASVGNGISGVTTSISTVAEDGQALTFSADGTKFLVGDKTGNPDAIFVGTLSTAWAIDSVSGITSVSFNHEAAIHGMVFNDDGTELWFTGTGNDSIKKITLATPYDYTTNVGTSTNTVSSANLNAIQDPVLSGVVVPRGLGVSSTGSYVYVLEANGIIQVKLDTPWDLDSYNVGLSTFVQIDATNGVTEFAGGPTLDNPRGIVFAHSDTFMYLVDLTLDAVLEYKLSTPGDVRTASYVRSQSVPNNPSDCFFGDNKFFVLQEESLSTLDYTGQPGTIYDVKLTGSGRGYQFKPGVSIASSIVGTAASITTVLGAGGTVTSFIVSEVGAGYSASSPVSLLVTQPTGYSNMDLHYAGISTGIGIEATAKVKIGVGSSIVDFEIDDHGRAYKVGDKLIVPGLIQDPNAGSFEEFQITVEEVQTDKFAGFYPGQFILFDDFASQFNGFRKKFTLTQTENGVTDIVSLKKLDGSDLVLENNLFIYVNDILQEPRKAYNFRGSRVIFTEAPKPNSTCTVMFYRGSSLDVETVNPPESIKRGDGVIIAENRNDPFDRDQFERIVKDIKASDEFDTFSYASVGIDTNPDNVRPLTWKKQEFDRIINGSIISKSRPGLSGRVVPNARVINDVKLTDTEVYVDNAFPIFSELDTISEDDRHIYIVEDRTTQVAIATAVVSSASTISSFVINNAGVGYAYTDSPIINISSTAIKSKDPINDWKTTSGIGSTTITFNSIEKGNVSIIVGSGSRYAFSAGSDVWFDNTLGFGHTITFNSVAVGGTNVYMVVGQYGYIRRSIGYGQTIDTSWTTMALKEDRSIPAQGIVNIVNSTYGEAGQSFNDVVYSPFLDKWAAVGTAGSIFSATGLSTDRFISVTSNSIQSINSVVATGEGIIAVGNNGTVLTSPNGQIYSSLGIAGVAGFNLNKIIYSNGKYVICGSGGLIATGDKFSTITKVTTNLTTEIVSVDYQDIYVALDVNGDLYYSFDASTWIQREVANVGSNTLKDLSFAPEYGVDGRYIVVGSGSTVIISDQVFNRATGETSQTSGIITSITVTNGGFGYSQDNPPAVLIESPLVKKEKIDSIKAVGDFGTIIGINTFGAGTVGFGTTTPKMEFVLKSETYDNTALGIGYSSLNTFGVSYSQLSKGDYFVIQNSNVAIGRTLVGITTLDGLNGMANYPDSVVGIMRTEQEFIDGVYRVEHVTTAQAGIVTVTCNFNSNDASVAGESIQVYRRGADVSGVNTNGFYGHYSWGKIYDFRNRVLGKPQSFTVDRDQGIVGLETAPFVYRSRSI